MYFLSFIVMRVKTRIKGSSKCTTTTGNPTHHPPGSEACLRAYHNVGKYYQFEGCMLSRLMVLCCNMTSKVAVDLAAQLMLFAVY